MVQKVEDANQGLASRSVPSYCTVNKEISSRLESSLLTAQELGNVFEPRKDKERNVVPELQLAFITSSVPTATRLRKIFTFYSQVIIIEG